MDDILIYSRTVEEHAYNVRRVLERLRQNRLYIKLSKCAFFTQEVDFLGFCISVDGVSMNPRRV